MAGQPVDAGDGVPFPEVWVSLSQLALLKRVSKQAISKRVKKLVADGLIETKADRNEVKVNLVLFDRVIGENTDPAQALRNPQVAMPAATAAAGSRSRSDPSGSDEESASYAEKRALREGYQAENARLDLLQRVGKTCDREEVEQRTFRVFRRARDRFLALPATASVRIFSAPDERTARQIMDDEIRKVLDALAVDLDRSAVADDEMEDVVDISAGQLEGLSDVEDGDQGAT